MDFVNHTPFPALSFEGLDLDGLSFHVLVLKQTLSFVSGSLEYADVQKPLCFADEPFGAEHSGALRQESDICHYKPRCDVIVNATAYAPVCGKPKTSFGTHLLLRREVAGGGSETLIDKSLDVTGPRSVAKRPAIVRAAMAVVRCATLGLVQPNPWRLTKPEAVNSVLLRPQAAYGGECRVNAGDAAARRVPKKSRLSEDAADAHPDRAATAEKKPVLHRAWQGNPRGKGFADLAFARATRANVFPAPQLEQPSCRFTAALFWDVLRGKQDENTLARQHKLGLAGFGTISKLAPQRVALCGTIDEQFIGGDRRLPNNFDFAYWNAAPEDQQIEFLLGGETVELVNLCAANAPGVHTDRDGNVTLRLTLPRHECFALCRMEDGDIYPQAMVIDTLVIEPEERLVSVVWRTVLPKDGERQLRAWEARMRSADAPASVRTKLEPGPMTVTAQASESGVVV